MRVEIDGVRYFPMPEEYRQEIARLTRLVDKLKYYATHRADCRQRETGNCTCGYANLITQDPDARSKLI